MRTSSVLGGKYSKEKNVSPFFIFSLILSMSFILQPVPNKIQCDVSLPVSSSLDSWRWPPAP